MTRDHGLDRTERVSLAVSHEELEQIKTNAAFFAMTVSEFLRHVALGGTIDWDDKALRKKAQERRKAVAG